MVVCWRGPDRGRRSFASFDPICTKLLRPPAFPPASSRINLGTMPRPGLCREIEAKKAWRLAQRGPVAHTHVKMRHSPEVESELFQECQQFVVGLKAFRSSFDRIGLGQGLFFQCEVGIEVDLSGFHRLMSEPKSNHRAIDAAL